MDTSADTTIPVLQMQNFYFPALGMLLCLLLHLYIYKAFLKGLATSRLFRSFWLVLSLMNMVGCILYFVFMRSSITSQALYFLVSLNVGVVFCLFVITVLYQLCSLGILFMRAKKSRAKARFYLRRFMGILALVFVIYAIANGTRYPQVHEISLRIQGLQDELKIVQLSDIHIGGLIESTHVRQIVASSNALKPDIVFLTGDIVDSQLQNVLGAVDELKNLSARYGIYYVLGNHEYFHDVKAIMQKFKSLGFVVLENDALKVETHSGEIIIAGIRDLVGVREAFAHLELKPNLKEALSKAKMLSSFLNPNPKSAYKESESKDSQIPVILLSHQPKIVDELNTLALTQPQLLENLSLILSGHTHGGQIFPFSLLVLLQQPHIKGLFELTLGSSLKTWLYINQGTGYWGPPMRVGTESEITLIRLKS
ncbi:MAG: metallophosphoesterase [Helicobacter sp.]|nr:metallophosphoesterase [Helicobacter sp.]MDY5741225.1 metallophosphoesterase [Helicobacter sp.]